MTDEPIPDADRLARGQAMYRAVYGDDAIVLPEGSSDFFDLMMAQLFGEVWSRPGLDVASRRLLVIGVLAAQYKYETLQIQLLRALETGELDVTQVREAIIHLIQYVGYPSSSDLYRASETAIAKHQKANS